MKLNWSKIGGHDQSRTIIYTASEGGFEIIRGRIGGSWSMPSLYRCGIHVRGFLTVAEAKQHAESLYEGKPLIDIL